MSASPKVNWNSSCHLQGLIQNNHHAVFTNCSQNWQPKMRTCKMEHITRAMDVTKLQPEYPPSQWLPVLNCASVQEITTAFCLDWCLHCKHLHAQAWFVWNDTRQRTRAALWVHISIFIIFKQKVSLIIRYRAFIKNWLYEFIQYKEFTGCSNWIAFAGLVS